MFRVLVVDEAEEVRVHASRLMEDMGFDVQLAENALTALAICNSELPRVIIIDAAMHAANELITAIRSMKQGNSVQILYASGNVDLRQLMRAKAAGADDFALKPFERKCLAQALSGLMQEADRIRAAG